MISLKSVLKGPINDIPALVQKMAWRRSGDKPLSEPMLDSLLTHICVTRPQWVKHPVLCSPNVKQFFNISNNMLTIVSSLFHSVMLNMIRRFITSIQSWIECIAIPVQGAEDVCKIRAEKVIYGHQNVSLRLLHLENLWIYIHYRQKYGIFFISANCCIVWGV